MNKPIKVVLLDSGKEWGGGTNSMLEWLRRRDKSQFQVLCVFYRNYARGGDSLTIEAAIRETGADFVLMPPKRQPLWAKFAKELVRGLLTVFPKSRIAAIQLIEEWWRIKPAAVGLARILRDQGADLLYMNNSPASNHEGYFAAAEAKVPVIQHCRTIPLLTPRLVRLLNLHANKLLAVSESVVEALTSQGVEPAKVRLLHNGIELKQEVPPAINLVDKLGIPAHTLILASVASLLPRKGVADVIQALAKITIPAHLLILGDGPQRAELEMLAKQLSVAERVHFLGFVPQPLPWIAAADILVLASESEGFGRVLLEGMFLAKPIVASNVPGTRNVVLDGETGLLFPYGKTESLAVALEKLWADPALAQQLGLAGHARAAACFDINRYAAAVSENLVEEIMHT